MKNNVKSSKLAKTLKEMGWLIACGALGFNALAAEPPSHEQFRAKQRSVFIIDMPVKDSQNQKLGRITDLALDLEQGRLVEVLVTSGGFLGFGQRTVAVPPGAFTRDAAGNGFHLNVDREMYQAAPDFKISKWAEECQSLPVAKNYRFFGQEPYFAADGANTKSGNTDTEPLGYVQSASKLLHFPVRNLQNEPLGVIDTFQCDLTSGRVFHLIVLSAGFPQTRSVIPASALRFNAAHDALQLDMTLQAFKNEPRFKWTDRDSGDFRQETYSNAKVAANDGVNTRQNVHEGTVNSYIPLGQGASFADVDITYRIYAAMRADVSLSQNAQNVEVGTLNRRITLRGHVNTAAGKRVIGEIAGKIGRPENVSNLLEVRLDPGTINLADQEASQNRDASFLKKKYIGDK